MLQQIDIQKQTEQLVTKGQARVSYLITTHNRASFLDKTLQNIREFITSDDELIITDGGSTDETPEVVCKHQDIITRFISEPDFGEAHGFNKGVLESNGRYIKFVTDDDYYFPEAMKQSIAVMEEHSELDAIICGGEELEFDRATNEPRLIRYQHLPESMSLTSNIQNVNIYVTCGIGLILTRRAISRLGLLDTSFHAVDRDYLARMVTTPIDFRYLNLKLWRHVNYPHSGENNIEKCDWDKLRISLQHGWWQQSMLYPTSRLVEALGLGSVKNGQLLGPILKEADWLREKLPFVLQVLIWALLGFHRVCFWAGSVGRAARNMFASERQSPRPDFQVEPQWDGSLR